MSELRTSRTELHRERHKGKHDRGEIYAILDAGLICHVAFVDSGHPFAIPTAYARDDDALLIHGSTASRMLRVLRAGEPICITVTLADGIVLARSAFDSSFNYRSVVILGSAAEVIDPAEKLRALELFTEHLVPGRWADVRPTADKELKATAVFRIPITEASAKVRTGPPLDGEDDAANPPWSGVIPLKTVADELETDPRSSDISVPDYLRDYRTPEARTAARFSDRT